MCWNSRNWRSIWAGVWTGLMALGLIALPRPAAAVELSGMFLPGPPGTNHWWCQASWNRSDNYRWDLYFQDQAGANYPLCGGQVAGSWNGSGDAQHQAYLIWQTEKDCYNRFHMIYNVAGTQQQYHLYSPTSYNLNHSLAENQGSWSIN